MKKQIIAILIFFFLPVGSVWAGLTVDSVTFDGGGSSTVNVVGGSVLVMDVTVTTVKDGDKKSGNWHSIEYVIGSEAPVCTTPEHHNHGADTYSESYNITAPNSGGSYAVTVTAYNEKNCTNGFSAAATVSNAIVVGGGNCSADLGDAVINEVAQSQGGDPSFIEVKMPTFTSSSSSWTLEVCDDSGCEVGISFLASSVNANGDLQSDDPWWILEGGEDFVDSHLDFKDGFSVALLDVSGAAIDVLSVNGFDTSSYNCSGYIYDIDVSGTNNGTKSVGRLPDGTGDWAIQQGNNIDETPGGSNEGDTTPPVGGTCEAVFPAGIQTHDPSGFIKVHLKNGIDPAKIVNSTTSLTTTQIISENNDAIELLCGSTEVLAVDDCTVNGNAAEKIDVVVETRNGGADLTINNDTTLGASGTFVYGELVVNDDNILTFSGDQDEYFIESLVLKEGAEVIMAAGVYWIETIFTAEKSSVLTVSSGVVEIFVENQVKFKDGSLINRSGSTNQLLMYSNASTEEFKLEKNVQAKGYFYSAGSFEFKDNSRLTGALSGANIDHIDYGAVITYELGALDFPNFCDNTPPQNVTHYAVYPVTPSITCEAGSVRVEPHDSDHNAISNDGGAINLSTQISGSNVTNDGWVIPDVNDAKGTLTGSSYEFSSGETYAILALRYTTPATLDIDVSDGSFSDIDGHATEDISIVFNDVGLRFYDDANADGNADSSGDDLPNQIAGVIYNQGVLRAIATDNSTGECVNALNSAATIAVNFAYECNNPNTCIRDKDFNIAGVAIEENANNSVAVYESVNLAFDAQGEAPFSMNYYDAGQITLHANMTIPAFGDDAAVAVNGESNAFVVKPYDLHVVSVQSSGGTPNPATTSAGNGFITAGEDFTVTVRAVNQRAAATPNAANAVTPNFGKETSAGESVELNFKDLIFPAGVNGSLTPGSFALTATDGEFDATDISWSEVGTFTAYASIASGNYLTSGGVTGSTSGNIGRFYPAQFQLSGSNLTNSCGSFSYMLQGMGVDYSVEAHNAYSPSAVVQNYDTGLGYPVTTVEMVAANNEDGTELTGRMSSPVGSWVAGDLSVSTTAVTFNRSDDLLNPIDGPFSNLQLALRLNDGDGADFDTRDFNAATAGCVDNVDCDARQLAGSLNLRHGRLFLQDVHGPESALLSVPFQSEYWVNSRWVLNTDDSCTQLPNTAIELDAEAVSVNRSVNVDGAGADDTTGSFGIGNVNNLVSTVDLAGGDAELFFSVPNVQGDFPVDVDLLAFPWLRFDWDQNADHNDDTRVPSATVSYGRYRGHDRVIYWQERLQ